MRLFFIGSQEYGYEILLEMLEQNMNIVGVITLEPSSHETWKKNVYDLAVKHEIPVNLFKDHLMIERNPNNINTPENIEIIQKSKPDLIFVVGWRQIIGKQIRQISKLGVVGLHFSLLPKFRGHAPVSWTIIENEEYAGLSIFYLDEGADTGDIIIQKRIKLEIRDTATTLRVKLTKLAREAFREGIIIPLKKGKGFSRIKQDNDNAIISAYRLPQHGEIDWSKNTIDIFNEIRATTHPYPGTFTYNRGKKVFIWSAELLPKIPKYVGKPGQIILVKKDKGVVVKTGDHAILIINVQLEGEKEVVASKNFKNTRESFGYNPFEEIQKLKSEITELREQIKLLNR